jgi:hypothetical protein
MIDRSFLCTCWLRTSRALIWRHTFSITPASSPTATKASVTGSKILGYLAIAALIFPPLSISSLTSPRMVLKVLLAQAS